MVAAFASAFNAGSSGDMNAIGPCSRSALARDRKVPTVIAACAGNATPAISSAATTAFDCEYDMGGLSEKRPPMEQFS
ncbi:hypothetical protein QP162_03410 [Sphingomonas aurantiaca]|uniref:hypothetical protein n=1 Tax=Sphingomonas aurantiaca TaxID=185949 RepID=UPI002FE26335